MDNQKEPPTDENLRTAYQEVCNSYHSIDDFRAKLLGILPIASAAGVLVLLKTGSGDTALAFTSAQVFVAGAFGAVVTVALFFYELRGVQQCGRLIEVAKELEIAMKVRGQFVRWPRSVGGVIHAPVAASLIYPVVMAAWLYVALVRQWPTLAQVVGVGTFALGVLSGVSFYHHVRPKEDTNMKPQILGLRVAGTIFGLVCLGQLWRLATRAEVIVAGYQLPLWVSALAVVIAGGLSLWLWTLARVAARRE